MGQHKIRFVEKDSEKERESGCVMFHNGSQLTCHHHSRKLKLDRTPLDSGTEHCAASVHGLGFQFQPVPSFSSHSFWHHRITATIQFQAASDTLKNKH